MPGFRSALAKSVLVGTLLALVVCQAVAQSDVPRVRAVVIESDAQGLDRRSLRSEIEIEAGESLDESVVRRSLYNLLATGVGSDIRAYRLPVDSVASDGSAQVDVLFEIVADFRVRSVQLKGELGVKRSKLTPLVEQRVGAPLFEDRLLRSVFSLQDYYQENGYRSASVRLNVDLDEVRKLADVVFEVQSGPRATIQSISFEGDLGPLEESQLRSALRAEVGKKESRVEMRDDRDRLRGWLLDQGFLEATVGPVAVVFDPNTNTIALRYPVQAGDRIEVRVQGLEKKKLERQGLLPFLGDAGYDPALVRRAVDGIREELQTKGFYRATVQAEEIKSADSEIEAGATPSTDARRLLELKIDQGPRYRLDALSLDGDLIYPESQLRQLLETRPHQVLDPGSGVLVDRVLEEDLRNLGAFYQLEGFSEVEIGEPIVQVGDSEGSGSAQVRSLNVTIPVTLGPRRRVSNLEFDGASALQEELGPDATVLDQLPGKPLEPGGPYHSQRLDDLLDMVRAAFDERGFDRAVVSSEISWSDDGRLADIEVKVLEGPKTLIDRVVVRGNLQTRSGVVRRVLGLERGQPLSRGSLLEAQRRLYQLGVFSSASVTPGPVRQAENRQTEGPGPEMVSRDVIVRLEEGRRWRLGYGVSFDSEDGVGGLFSASLSNFAGRASTLRLDLRANENEQRYRLLYTDRSIGRGVTPLSYSLYRVSELISAFRSERYGLQVEAARFFGDVRASVFFDYRNVDLEDENGGGSASSTLPDEITRDLLEVELTSLTGTLQVDERNDPLDPTRGVAATLQFERAFSLFGTEEEFSKLFAQTAYYRGLGRVGTLALNLRAGAIEPESSGSADRNTVPISERFFTGGRTTHRAFSRDELGIPGRTVIDGIPVGGNGLLLLNLDYRFPISGPVGGTVFVDGGNVWDDYDEVDLSDVRWGAGVGARYLSPIGPVRLEVGWKLDREVGEDAYEVFLSFGNAF